jgi:pimeloyl-ACP methyl ester carboxylesterase
LTDRWRKHDWSATEARLARHEQLRVDCGTHVLHAMRVRAPATRHTALLLHGWPSSVLEMVGRAEDLAAGDPACDDVVIASAPGFGLSDRLGVPGPTSYECAGLYLRLMEQFGIDRFWVHAYDVSTGDAARMALRAPDRVLGYHTTEPGLPRARWAAEELTQTERDYLAYAASAGPTGSTTAPSSRRCRSRRPTGWPARSGWR